MHLRIGYLQNKTGHVCDACYVYYRALKRQTDSQAEAYLRLLEENNQLKVRTATP